MTDYAALFTPFRLKHLTLRNRIMSTAHGPHFAEADGTVGERYVRYHAEKAKGGLALTMFGGSSSVAIDSPLTMAQLSLAEDRMIPGLRRMAEAVHEHGAAVVCQMTHLGRRSRWDRADWLPVIGPSSNRERIHRAFAKEMEDFDFVRVRDAFAAAAGRLKTAGIDGGEVLMTSHHLMDSFLSPLVNTRGDEYGGDLSSRMKFPLEVLAAMRAEVGDDFVIGIRLVGDEMLAGGLTPADCMAVAHAFEASGLIDYINVFQAHGDTAGGLAKMMPDQTYGSAPFLHLPSAIRAESNLPILHASGIRDLATANRAVAEGHVDMVAMTRAHVADPHFVTKIREGRPEDVRVCLGLNYCIDRVWDGADMVCAQNVATGREMHIPQVLRKGEDRRNVVVVGAGPAGLEAARVAAGRGHRVVLFEKAERVGGQVNLAVVSPFRETIGMVPRWLEAQARKLGVDIRLNTEATEETILAEAPDLVLIATGGQPRQPSFRGAELCVNARDVIAGRVAPADNVLFFDDCGGLQGLTAASYLADRVETLELATAEERPGYDAGETSRLPFLRHLKRAGVVMTVNADLTEVYSEGNKLVAVLKDEMTEVEEERLVGQVVIEAGVLPCDDLYQALRPKSVNLGAFDQHAWAAFEPQPKTEGKGFRLYRIGDAVAGRNIHAGMYEAMRFAMDA